MKKEKLIEVKIKAGAETVNVSALFLFQQKLAAVQELTGQVSAVSAPRRRSLLQQPAGVALHFAGQAEPASKPSGTALPGQ